MFSYYFILSQFLLLVSSMKNENLQELFGNKHCIEASLVTFSVKNDPIMMDSSTETLELAPNKTVFDKSVTTKAHELAQHNNIEFLYKLISEEGPAHAKHFTVKLMLGDETYEGSGSSLKAAKQSAAGLALENTLYEHPPEKIKVNEQNAQTPTVVLNNLAMKLGIAVSYYLLNGQEEQSIEGYGGPDDAFGGSKSSYPKWNSTFDPLRVPVEDEKISGPFTVKVKVGDFAVKGIGHTIQAARHDAALNAIKHMEKEALLRDNVCSRDETAEECKQKKESLKSPVSRVHEIAQKHNLPVSFDVISETGKSHKKVFITRCILGELVTEGEGNSKKESKRVAAEKMLEHLPALSSKFGDYDENAVVNGLSKKKKNKKKKKIVRETASNIIVDSVSTMVSSLWSSTDDALSSDDSNVAQVHKKPTQKRLNRSPKDKILEIGRKLNIPIEFTDLGKRDGEFGTLMSLGVRPPHICLGKAPTRDASHDAVAARGMKFLQKSGIYDQVQFKENEQSGGTDEDVFEDETVFENFDDMEPKENF